jgi:hypothetical protein
MIAKVRGKILTLLGDLQTYHDLKYKEGKTLSKDYYNYMFERLKTFNWNTLSKE